MEASDACLRFLCNSLADDSRDHSSEVIRSICPELRTMVRFLCNPLRSNYAIKRIMLGGRQVQLGRQDEHSRGDTCSVLFWEVVPSQKSWTLADCIALRTIFYEGLEKLEETDDLFVIVVNCKVDAEATNAGFHPWAPKRCIPVHLEKLQFLETQSPSCLDKYAPKVICGSEVARLLGTDIEQLASLPLLFVNDPIVLLDLQNIRVGSYVFCPGSASSLFRIVSSCLRDS